MFRAMPSARAGRQSLLGASLPTLGFSPAFPAAKPRDAATISAGHLGYAVNFADRRASAGIAAMHPAVPNWVDRLDVLRAAAGRLVAGMMDVLSGRPAQGLVDEAVNATNSAVHPHKAVAIGVLRSGPKPALTFDNQARIEAQKSIVREHPQSIQNAGDNARPFGRPSTIAGDLK